MAVQPEQQKPSDKGPLPAFRSWYPHKPTEPKLFSLKWLLVPLVILAVISLIVVAALLARRRPRAEPLPVVTTQDTTERMRCFTVRSGETMTSLLARAEVRNPAVDEIIGGLRLGSFNFRRMKPGDSLMLAYGDDRLHRLYYRRSFERTYRLDLDSADCRVSMLLRSIRRVPGLITGHIESSLYQALLDQGETVALVADFADIFGWEIDFFCETQKSDSFTILVERRFADSAFVGYGRIRSARYQGQVGDFRAYRFTDPTGHTDYYNAEGQSLRKTFLKSPLRFSRVTSYFGSRFHPIRRIRCQHSGVDYAAPRGTPVSCVADGRVTFAGRKDGYGKLVEVGHSNGLKTRYGHLSRFGKGIKTGVPVEQGQVIGRVGSTGLSTGPHLHYEVRKFGTAINPLKMRVPRADPVKLPYVSLFNAKRDSLAGVMEDPATATPQPQPDQAPR